MVVRRDEPIATVVGRPIAVTTSDRASPRTASPAGTPTVPSTSISHGPVHVSFAPRTVHATEAAGQGGEGDGRQWPLDRPVDGRRRGGGHRGGE